MSAFHRFEGVGIDIHFFVTTSPRLVTRADPFDAMCCCVRVPSIEDGLPDDYGGYDLRYRSSLHPVFLCIHLWMLTYMYGIAPYN